MADFSLKAQPRTVVGKRVKNLRREGLVPITVYGPKIDPVSLQVPYRELEVTLRDAGGTNLIDVNVDGDKHTAIARDVQRDVVKGSILHVDFYAVDATTTIRADIPIYLVGTSPAVEAREGILLTGANNVTVETLPAKLTNQIEVDLSKLKAIGDSITIGDLDLGEGVVIINEPEEMIARISQTSAARAELLEAIEEDEMDDLQVTEEPEVISRGKEEEEEFLEEEE